MRPETVSKPSSDGRDVQCRVARTFQIDHACARRLRRVAQKTGVSQSRLVNFLIERHLEQIERRIREALATPEDPR